MLFSNTTVYVAQAEMDYWFDPKNAEAAPEDKKHAFKEAHAIDPCLKANKLVAIREGGELLPCVTAIPAPGPHPWPYGVSFYLWRQETASLGRYHPS